MKKLNFNSDFLATALGLVVAIANAWITIDWVNFDIKKEYPKLMCSAIIAIGGFISETKRLKK